MSQETYQSSEELDDQLRRLAEVFEGVHSSCEVIAQTFGVQPVSHGSWALNFFMVEARYPGKPAETSIYSAEGLDLLRSGDYAAQGARYSARAMRMVETLASSQIEIGEPKPLDESELLPGSEDALDKQLLGGEAIDAHHLVIKSGLSGIEINGVDAHTVFEIDPDAYSPTSVFGTFERVSKQLQSSQNAAQ